jgi:hypothetical protein
METYTNSEMTDMVFCYGSADGVGLRAQAFYRKNFRRVVFAFANISGCCTVRIYRENGTFRPTSVDRGQERTPRVLDLEPQILETVEENP